VSLQWNRSVRLRLGATSVRGTLYAGWPQRCALARASHSIDSPPQSVDGQAPPAAAPDPQSRAIDAVLSELTATLPLRGAHLAAELAEELILLDVVEGDYGGSSERQLQSIAAACVAELLGDAASGHVVRWQLQPDLRHLLICAIARQEVELLEQAALRHGLKLASVQPGFCAQWNRHGGALPEGTGVLGVTSGLHALVACAARGVITAVSSGPCREDGGAPSRDSAPTNALDSRVDRLLASAGLDVDSVSAFVLVAPHSPVPTLSPRWTLFTEQPEAA
jgi:hypothetical protein